MSPYAGGGRLVQRRQRPLTPRDPRRSRRSRQGLSAIEVDALIAAQANLCALCGRPLGVDTMVDHDHALAAAHGHEPTVGCRSCVRGILCRGCNTWLSSFRSDPAFLRRAAEYAASRRPG